MDLADSINQIRSSVSRERLVSSCKLVCVAPETPHIYLFAVRKTCVNVRTDPLKICSMLLSIVLSLQKVRQTKVCNLDCTIGTAEYSLTCDFSVNHTFCVHYLHTFGNLVKRVLAELLKISFAAPWGYDNFLLVTVVHVLHVYPKLATVLIQIFALYQTCALKIAKQACFIYD